MWNILAAEWIDPPTADDRLAWRVIPDLWSDRARLLREVQDADALLIRDQTRVDAEVLAAAPRLQVVGRLGAGLDNIDLDGARRRGVKVVYAPSANARAVAELALTQIMALLRRFPAAAASTARGEWRRIAFFGREISGCTVGVVGFGAIGSRIAALCDALGARVLVHTRRPEAVERFPAVSLDALLHSADVVSLSTPGGPGTRHLIGRRELASMKPGSFIVNTARGTVIDEEALAWALRSGHLAGAALDVREVEPPLPGILEDLPNVLLTPHMGAYTTESQLRVAQTVVEDVTAVLEGREPRWAAE